MTNGQEALSRMRSQSANFHVTQTFTGLPNTGIAPFLAVGDIAFVAVGCLVGLAPLQRADSLAAAGIAAVITIALLRLVGLYRSRLTLSVLDDLPYLAMSSIGGALAASYLLDRQPLGFGLKGVAFVAAGVFVFAVAWRAIGYETVRQLRAHGLVNHRTLIVGRTPLANEIARTLHTNRKYGLRLTGFLDAEPDHTAEGVLGATSDLADCIQAHDIDVVIIAAESDRTELVESLRACDRVDAAIFWVPTLYETLHRNHDMDELWGIPLVRATTAPHRTQAWSMKRVFDIVAASLLLILAAPVMAVVALGVRLETGPGVLFRQKRVGLDGEEFELLKFRSLKPASVTESQTTWNVAGDNRMGAWGKLIRAWSLDELPQLFNVLRGDMSMVGPRPERRFFVEQFNEQIPAYRHRHRVPVGLTGWAAVNGLRGNTSIPDRARFDNYYAANWSLWLDFKILLLTVVAVLKRTGA